jgi:hypothetical protein
MAQITRRKRNLQPVTGTCKWVRRLGVGEEKTGLLEINEQTYGLIVFDTAYELVKADGTTYHLPLDLAGCDCPDATYNGERPEGCKHRKALVKLLASLK